MELVREEDRSAIELKEGQRCELGRGSGLVKEADESVSRLHVVVELLRPASRKGKEVVGEFPALKLHVQVVGKNPICITSAVGGAEDKNTPRVKFVSRGENDWLAPGDRFALSIRRPLFFLLRQRAYGSLGRDEREESLSSERTIIEKTVEDSIDDSVEKNVMDVKANSLEEEEGIARAVARRQRRRLEREEEQRTMEFSEQQQKWAQNCGLERTAGRIQPDAESQEVASVVPCQDSGALHPFDPVAEFGFVVNGSEFQAYEQRTKTANGLPWNWKIDKKGETVEGVSEDESMVDVSGRNSKILAKILKRSEEEDEEWGGDSKEEEERIAKAVRSKVDISVSTRSRGSNTTEHKRKNPRTPDALLSTRSERASKEANDLSAFIVDDEDSIDELEDEEDWMDDEGTPPRKTEKGVSSEISQKPVCKYGSNCYRKNKEHLAQFSHQQR